MRHLEGVTVFVPVYNEEALLVPNGLRLQAFLEDLGRPYEIIIGSNGSTDGTVRQARELCRQDSRFRLFHLPRKGVGKAFKNGIRISRYDRIVTVDMDLSIHLGFVEEACLLLDRYDMVIGSKITGTQDRAWIRRLASISFIRLAGILLRIHYHDYSIAAKGYRKDMVEGYLPFLDDHTFYVVQIVYRANREKKKITEIPVACTDLRGSRFNLIHEGIYKYANLFSLWLSGLKKQQ
ncbi:MAG: glycosyltransferase family 2 protein [Deltaproteobacteria bacterium]|nr:glycosyltransferase family 2 protein [Deltaproteobacteria bacterium]